MANINSGVVQLVELGNDVVQITMKDEENRNTFSPGIIEGLYKCFGAVAQNKCYKVVILTGYGNYFCSGGTKEQLISIHKGEIKCNELDFFRILLDCQIPVIAAMQGHSIGGGLVFGFYADLVVLSQESFYTTNFMKYGFTPGIGCTLIVPEKLGAALGHEMMYTAKNYQGEELVKRGIPFPVLPRKEVLKFATKIAYEMAEKPRLSLITLKEHLTSGIKKKLPEFIDKELTMHEITFHKPEVATKVEKTFGETTIIIGDSSNLSQGTVRQETRKNTPSRQPFQLKIPSYGLLSNLTLAPLEGQVPGPNEVEVQIKAVPVNFRDVLNALGMLQDYNEKRFGCTSAEDLIFGWDASGTIVNVGEEVSRWKVGNEVVLVGPYGSHGAFSSFITCSQDRLLAKPTNLNLVDAATVPGPFLTSYHGLYNLAKIQPGEKVLIHAASGATGQAAVKLAQVFGAEVFATTSPSKMSFLREQGIKHVMNSRTTEFASEVMELTQRHGVDIIFSSLTHGEYIQKNLDTLTLGGRYIEIGKLNIWSHEQFYQKRPDVKYFPFDLIEEFARDNQLYSKIWDNLSQYFEHNDLQPLPYKEFPIEDVVEAFRYLQHSKHIGRVVVTMPEFYCREGLNTCGLSKQDQMIQQEEILNQLQSGDISVENAEQLLLGFAGEKVQAKVINEQMDNGQNKLMNPDNPEESSCKSFL